MSFFGGGTDMPEFFAEHGGAVLSTTFDKYCYVSVRHLPPFFDYRNEAVYSVIERTKTADTFDHPLIREAMKHLDMHNLRITYDSDLPARSGLGTSSSFAVGLLNAFYAIKGKTVTAEQLAQQAIHIERELCQEAGGWQDQIAAAFGGFNRIDFAGDTFQVSPIKATNSTLLHLNRKLLLFFTGFARYSHKVQETLQSAIPDKVCELQRLKTYVDEAEAILVDGRNLDQFGLLLDESWQIKRSLTSSVSNTTIDDLYRSAQQAGAVGGKLLGSGSGGFLLFYAAEDRHDTIRQALHGLMEVPFSFENSGASTLYCVAETFTKTNDRSTAHPDNLSEEAK
jgi:D-glycero-alpha-D-manno-heptose-7-phosphate kinase